MLKYAVPIGCNKRSLYFKSITLDMFKTALKTLLFKQAYNLYCE